VCGALAPQNGEPESAEVCGAWLSKMGSRKNAEVCVVLAPQNGELEGRSNWGYVINTEEDEYVSQV
jgi:hypothetical protein